MISVCKKGIKKKYLVCNYDSFKTIIKFINVILADYMNYMLQKFKWHTNW